MCIPLLIAGCDPEVVGVSTALRVASAPSDPVVAGSKFQVVFQALDDHQKGVPDRKLEVLVTDPSRLKFVADPDTTRLIVSTGRSTSVSDAVLEGAVAVDFSVPKDAVSGAASVVASLDGDRGGSSSKTRWVNITVEGEAGAPSASGGAGAGAADAGGASAGGASAGGTAGSGDVGGNPPSGGGDAGAPGAGAGAGAAGGGGASGEGGAGATGTSDAGSAGT